MSARKGFKQIAQETPSPLEVARMIAPTASPSAAEDPQEDVTAGMNMRAKASTLDALVRVAADAGLTQKQIVMQGLVKMGVAVSPEDLLDGSPAARRRKRVRKS